MATSLLQPGQNGLKTQPISFSAPVVASSANVKSPSAPASTQYNAIAAGANTGNLISQLFGGTSGTTPMTTPTRGSLFGNIAQTFIQGTPTPLATTGKVLNPNQFGTTPAPISSTATTSTPTTPTTSTTATAVQPATSQPYAASGSYNANAGYNAGVATPVAPAGTPVATAPAAAAGTAPTAQGLLSKVAGYAAPDSGLTDLYNQEQNLATDYANKYGGILNTPSTLNFQTGRLASLQSEENSAQAALSGNYTANLAQRAQGIGAAENALGASTDLQSSPYGEPQVNVATGQTYSGGSNTTGTSGGNLDPQTQATSLAQQVISGQMTYDQAVQSLGYAGSVGTNFLNNAITGAGGNLTNLQAQGSATQGVVDTQTQTKAGYQSSLQQGQNLQSQLTDLITQFGLNPNDVNAVNIGIQKIAQNTSDPRYQILQNYINDIANTYAQVLTPAGGSTTDQSRAIATSMLNATASGQSILAVMKSLDQAAQAKIAGVSTTGSGSTGSSGSSIYSF